MKKLLTLAGIASLVGAGFLFSSASAESGCVSDQGLPDAGIGDACGTVDADGVSGYADGADTNPDPTDGYVRGSANADGIVEICASDNGDPAPELPEEEPDPEACNEELLAPPEMP